MNSLKFFSLIPFLMLASSPSKADPLPRDLPTELVDFFRAPVPQTYEEAMARIPLPYKGNFAGIKKSTSAQPSTDTEPRILLFHPNEPLDTGSSHDIMFSISSVATGGHDPWEIEFAYWSQARGNMVFGSLAPGPKGYVYHGDGKCVGCHDDGGLITSIKKWPLKDAREFYREKCARSSNAEGAKIYNKLDCETFAKRVGDAGESLNKEFERRVVFYARKRAVRILAKQRPKFERVKFALLGALSSCPDFQTSFLPKTAQGPMTELDKFIRDNLQSVVNRRQGADKDALARLAVEEIQINNCGALGRVMEQFGGLPFKELKDALDMVGSTMRCDLGFTAHIQELLNESTILSSFMKRHGLTTQDLLRNSGCSAPTRLTAQKKGQILLFCRELSKESLGLLSR